MANKLKLNIGCGHTKMEGWVNCDLHPGDGVDSVFDLQGRWPFDDNSVCEIYGSHVLEHLPDHNAFFSEAHRVMQPKATMVLRIPYGMTKAAWWDMTHVRPWLPECFCGLQPGYVETNRNRQYDAQEVFFDIVECSIFLARGWARFAKTPFLRRYIWFALNSLHNVAEEFWVFAVKVTKDATPTSGCAAVVPVSLSCNAKYLGGTDPGDGTMRIHRFPMPKPSRLQNHIHKTTWGLVHHAKV